MGCGGSVQQKYKSSAPPPDFVELRLPELEYGMRGLPVLAGTYKLNPVSKTPMWDKQNSAHVLREIDGQWHIGETAEEQGMVRSRDKHKGRWPHEASLWWDYWHKDDAKWKGIVLKIFRVMSPMDKARIRQQTQVAVKSMLEEDWMTQPESVRGYLEKEFDMPGDEFALVPERVVEQVISLRLQAAASFLGGLFDAADVHHRGKLDIQCLNEAFETWIDLGTDAHASIVAGACTALVGLVLEQLRLRTNGPLLNPEQRRIRSRRCWVTLQDRARTDFMSLEDSEEANTAIRAIWDGLTKGVDGMPPDESVTRKRFINGFLEAVSRAAGMHGPMQEACRSLIGTELQGGRRSDDVSGKLGRSGRSASTDSNERSRPGRLGRSPSTASDDGGRGRRVSTASDGKSKGPLRTPKSPKSPTSETGRFPKPKGRTQKSPTSEIVPLSASDRRSTDDFSQGRNVKQTSRGNVLVSPDTAVLDGKGKRRKQSTSSTGKS
eukprot:Hpha_TRINITY_DN16127_c2_g6::TRINITY_DN16127_c2_g6_i1::g.5255::m.5255